MGVQPWGQRDGAEYQHQDHRADAAERAGIARPEHAHHERQEHHEQYVQALGGQFVVQRPPEGATVASISFGLLANDAVQRRAIVKALAGQGIETRIFSAGNLGLHPFWVNRYGKASFPVADRIHHCGFFLPNHASMNEEDVSFISKVVLEAA